MVTSINQPSSYLFLYNIFYSQAKLINPFKKRRSLFVRRFQFPKFKASSSSYCPLFSIFRSPSLIFINLLLRYFRQFHPPSRRRLFSDPNPTHQLSLNLINRFKQMLMGPFTISPVTIYQKSVLNYFNSFTNISDYLNLWDISRFILRHY